ncbi:hypothetical protein JCM8097_001759 [Rhodosporidiobolus ruineniae]
MLQSQPYCPHWMVVAPPPFARPGGASSSPLFHHPLPPPRACMARRKGQPQRPGGVSRAELQRQLEAEERSKQLAALDEALEQRHGTRAHSDDGGEQAEGADAAAPPPANSPQPPLQPQQRPQVFYSSPPAASHAPPQLRPPGFAHPHPRLPPSSSLPPQVPTYATLPSGLYAPPPPVSAPPTHPAAVPSPVQLQPPSSTPAAPPGLSRFAEKYVPMWLRNVNASMPHAIVPRSPAEAFSIDYAPIHETLFPNRLLSLLSDIEGRNVRRVHQALAQLNYSPIRGTSTSPIPPLTPTNYALHFIPLLQAEWQARSLQLQQAALYAAPLRPVPRHPSEPPGPPNYILEAKSIREGWPPVDLGDALTLRQLQPEHQTWQGLEFTASVAGINRAAGEVILRCDSLFFYQQSLVFNVMWKVQERIFNEWRCAVEMLDLHITSDTLISNPPPSSNGTSPRPRKRTAVESWLFPEPEDVMSTLPAPVDDECDWVDSSLNEEQRNAVRSILWGQQRLPLLLHGPPGTGKTKTLVEGVLQILKRHPHAHVLVCGASNPSTDTLAMRLQRSLSPKELLRLNSPSRPFAEVRGELLPYCHIENDRFALPTMQQLLSKRVICCTVLDASLLLRARASNHDLSTLEVLTTGYIHPTLSDHNELQLAKPHFSYLLIDEAGQATETDVACALSVVATDDSRCGRAHVTICGDPQQLGPHINSEEARAHDFDVSLLERLMSRPVYADHPCSRKNRRMHPDAKWDLRTTPFVDLVKNYRSTPEILWLPSTEFYHETLQPAAASSIQGSPLRDWFSLPNRGFPMMFQHVAGDDLEMDEGASFFNDAEVTAVRQLILDLVRPPSNDPDKGRHGAVQPKEISVIAPFREQVWRIRLALRAVGLGEVDVGNVEALQGAENRVVIISTVRSKELRWLPIDRQQNRGVLFEPKRFNVAMTRAKELLVVVGNAETLTMDPYWKAFYRLCLRNRCYVGPPVQNGGANELGHAVSKLEADYARRRAGPARSGASSRSPALNGHDGEDEDDEDDEEKRQQARDFDILIGRLATQLVNDE